MCALHNWNLSFLAQKSFQDTSNKLGRDLFHCLSNLIEALEIQT